MFSTFTKMLWTSYIRCIIIILNWIRQKESEYRFSSLQVFNTLSMLSYMVYIYSSSTLDKAFHGQSIKVPRIEVAHKIDVSPDTKFECQLPSHESKDL